MLIKKKGTGSRLKDKARRRKGRLTRGEAGKGDSPRPFDRARYESNFDAIVFKHKEK